MELGRRTTTTKRKPFSDITNTTRPPNLKPQSPSCNTSIGSNVVVDNSKGKFKVYQLDKTPVRSRLRKRVVDTDAHQETSENVSVYSPRRDAEKRRDKRKAVAVNIVTAVPRECNTVSSPRGLDERREKGKAIPTDSTVHLVSGGDFIKMIDKGKSVAIDVSVDRERNTVYSSRDDLERMRDKGKAVAIDVAADKERNTVYSPSDDREKRREKGKAFAVDGAVDRERDPIYNRSSVSGKRKDKRKAVIKDADDYSRCRTLYIRRHESENRVNKGKPVAIPFPASCPPPDLRRSSSTRHELHNMHDSGDLLNEISGLSTTSVVPHQKKRRSSLPAGLIEKREYKMHKVFIEEQNRYFKEVDDYELDEEVVSESELE